MAKNLKNILVNFLHDDALKQQAVNLQGCLIDIGCGTKPYRDLLKNYVTEHIGVDHEATFHNKGNIDLFGTAYDMFITSIVLIVALCDIYQLFLWLAYLFKD